MRRRSGKRKLDMKADADVQTAKRYRRTDQEPKPSLTDDVDYSHEEASTTVSIRREPRPVHTTIENEEDDPTSRQQTPKVGGDEKDKQATSNGPGELMQHMYCNSTTQALSSLKTEASPSNIRAAGEHIQHLIFKTEAQDYTAMEANSRLVPVENTEGNQVSELCEKIQRLSAKRKHFKDNEEILKKRLKQSRLTYAELLRKQSKLMKSLAELKSCLNADEKLLSDEKQIADQIPDEIERLSIQLARLCSSQATRVEDIR